MFGYHPEKPSKSSNRGAEQGETHIPGATNQNLDDVVNATNEQGLGEGGGSPSGSQKNSQDTRVSNPQSAQERSLSNRIETLDEKLKGEGLSPEGRQGLTERRDKLMAELQDLRPNEPSDQSAQQSLNNLSEPQSNPVPNQDSNSGNNQDNLWQKLDDLKNRSKSQQQELGNKPLEPSLNNLSEPQSNPVPNQDSNSGNNQDDLRSEYGSSPRFRGNPNPNSEVNEGQPGITIPRERMDYLTNRHNQALDHIDDKYKDARDQAFNQAQENNDQPANNTESSDEGDSGVM